MVSRCFLCLGEKRREGKIEKKKKDGERIWEDGKSKGKHREEGLHIKAREGVK